MTREHTQKVPRDIGEVSLSGRTTDTGGASAYYQHSTSLASRISWHVRQKMFRTFMEAFHPGPQTAILDVGVTSDTSFQESNYLEQLYPHPHRITCVGTEDGSHLEVRYPGLSYRRVNPGESLPFADGAFDIVFSNAVLEHVGNRAAQARFVRELCRVGKNFFITTPNRWFPVEHHSGVPFLHFLPARSYRTLLRLTRYRYWAKEENLNMLTQTELARLFPPGQIVAIKRIELGGLCSNLIALGKSA
jgi:SAM-dependent methyltransferase